MALGRRAPVWIMPGQADDCVTVHRGYGRKRAGRVGTGLGFDANAIRTASDRSFVQGVTIRRTRQRHLLATTQEHHAMEGRDLVRTGSLSSLAEDRRGGSDALQK